MPRLQETIREYLLGDIVGGRYSPDDPLPREEALAEEHKVSRGVVREALRGLEERRLIQVKHGVGAKVRPASEWNVLDPDVLTALTQADEGADVLAEYLEARRILEIEAAGLAAERATDDDLATLEDTYARMVETAEQARASRAAEKLYQEADIGFHRDVVRAAGNRALASMTEPIHRAFNVAFERLARPEARFERGLPEHRRILKGIVARDPDAARDAMAAHLRTVEGYLDEYAKRQKKRRRRSRK